MDFPYMMTDDEIALRVKEWQVSGYVVVGCPLNTLGGRDRGRMRYEPDQRRYWKLFIEGEGEIMNGRTEHMIHEYERAPSGEWFLRRIEWPQWTSLTP